MKKKILFTATSFGIMIFVCFSSQAFSAIKVDFGIKAGFNISGHWSTEEKSDDDSVKSSTKNGVLFGAMARFSLSDFFKLQPELLYIQKGSKQDVTVPSSPIGPISVIYDLQYIEIPVVLKLYFLKGKGFIQPTFSLGPYLAFLLKGTYTFSNDFIGTFEQDIDGLKSTDMGIIFGSGIEFKFEKMELSIQYRYSMGFADLALPTGPNSPTITMRNLSYMFTLEIVL